jgi:hypothetical protein
MTNDARKVIFTTILVFLVGVSLWVGFLFTVGCNGSLDCGKAEATPYRTSIPTLIPATLPAPEIGANQAVTLKCRAGAIDLIAAWINSGYPEADPFDFTDTNGTECTATYTDDVSVLFKEANIWYSGSQPCASCHNADVLKATAQLDMSTYQGMLMGSRRTSETAKGNDIFGAGNWEASKMYEVLITRQGQPLAMPLGRPVDMDATTIIVFAGTPKVQP